MLVNLLSFHTFISVKYLPVLCKRCELRSKHQSVSASTAMQLLEIKHTHVYVFFYVKEIDWVASFRKHMRDFKLEKKMKRKIEHRDKNKIAVKRKRMGKPRLSFKSPC